MSHADRDPVINNLSAPSPHAKTPSLATLRTPRLRILAVRYLLLGTHTYAESDLRQLITLARRGNHVTAFVARTSPRPPTYLEGDNFELRTVWIRRQTPILHLLYFGICASWQVIKNLSALDCLILDAMSTALLLPTLVMMGLIGRGSRPAMLLRVETNPVETGNPIRNFLLTICYSASIRFAAQKFDKVLFITPMLASYYDRFKVPRAKISIWPSSVDLAVFRPRSPSAVSELKKTLNPRNQLVVLYHGTLTKTRGILETVEAFRMLHETGFEAKLVLLGNGPIREQLIEYVRSSGLQDSVLIPNPTSSPREVANYIAISDVEIVPLPDHPWWRYQSPIKILESLAMNKPLIASNIPAIRYVVGDSKIIVYLEECTPRAIAKAVRHFSEIKENFDLDAGRKIASDYSVDSVSRTIEQNILSAIKNKSRPNNR
ncbi:MAG: glycosyltransferase family 4 protein [Candidatus Bathyarchaeia archaeon]